MEDEEEIQSHAQPNQSQNGRVPSITQPVTVAAAPPQHILTLALPIQQPRTGGGREDCWSKGATSTLIDAWGERYLELSRGNLKQKHWKDVADIVSSREDYTKPPKTDVQCKNRIDTLKKKYKLEKAKIASGQGPSKWPFFHRLHHLIGPGPGPGPNSKITANAPKAPMAIPDPVGNRRLQRPQQQQLNRTPGSMDSNSSRSQPGASPDSTDGFPPDTDTAFNRKRPRFHNAKPVKPETPQRNTFTSVSRGNSIRELTRAILDFGDAYERAEASKLQHVVEMETQRMGFAKELELQRMQFLMKTQLELTQLKHVRRVGNSHHHHNNNSRNNSD